jgi:hypothetical protein
MSAVGGAAGCMDAQPAVAHNRATEMHGSMVSTAPSGVLSCAPFERYLPTRALTRSDFGQYPPSVPP